MKTLPAVLLIAALLGLPAAQALEPAQWSAAKTEFSRANAGAPGASAAAAELFAKLAEQEPRNPLVLAYLGAAESLQGRDAWAPWKKMSFAEQGVADLDRALSLLKPEHLQAAPGALPVAAEVKLTTASTFLALPGFFNRAEAGARLLHELLGEPAFDTLPARFRASALKLAAETAQKAGNKPEAMKHLRKLAQIDSPLAAQARSQLAELEK